MTNGRTRHYRRLAAGIGVVGLCALGATPAAAAPGGNPGPPNKPSATAPQPTAPSTTISMRPITGPAILVMQVWTNESDLVAQGTLVSLLGKPLTGEKVSLEVDGQKKAEGTVDDSGAWQASVGLDQVQDGRHTAAGVFAGSDKADAAKVQTSVTTKQPRKTSDLSGTFVKPNGQGITSAEPGEEVNFKGTLKASDGKPLGSQQVSMTLGSNTTSATTGDDGGFTIKGNVPSTADVGSSLNVLVTFAGGGSVAGKTITTQLSIQKASPSATPTPTPTATPTPTITATGSVTPGVTGLSVPTGPLSGVGFGVLVPFIVTGMLAVGAAGGLGYWLYTHRDDDVDAEA